jgi:hypothetical protein
MGATMAVESHTQFSSDAMTRHRLTSPQAADPQTVAKMKARQAAKIREIASALVAAGFHTLDAQAKILNVGRSTAWTIIKGSHKGSGLSAKIVNRILSVRQLPPLVRKTILEYIEEKASGRYGHSARLRRRFITALSARRIEENKKARIAALARRADRDALNTTSTWPAEPNSATARVVNRAPRSAGRAKV